MSAPPTIEQLRVEASRVRSFLENSDYRLFASFPKGCCKLASVFLLRWLSDRLGVSDGFLIAEGSRQGQSHAWARVGRCIVDITADQFEDFEDPSFVEVQSEWHRSFLGTKEFPQKEATHLHNLYEVEYMRMSQSLAWAAQQAVVDGPVCARPLNGNIVSPSR